MRTLKNDPHGTAVWIEREARSMDPMQLYREFVQNGIEAGGNQIIVDGWVDPETGHRLARITDDGCGLTAHQLIERLTSLHGQFKADNNYGVGARIASLPFNQAGVTFASRTTNGEAMVTLHKHRGEYGIKSWQVEDEDGYIISVEVVDPDPGMLSRLPDGSTGTAVILHGNGRSDTWNTSISYQVHKFLTRRYYDFGAGINVYVQDMASSRIGNEQLRAVVPVGEYLVERCQADGEVLFKNIAGLTGVMSWWIIPTQSEVAQTLQGRSVVPGGVGLVVENEIFDYARTYLGDFGIIYPSVQARVAILVWIDAAEMGTARADVVLPGQNRRAIPWKKLGAHFAENMPAEIDELLSKVTVVSSSFDAEMAKLLDKDWMKMLAPVKVNIASKDGEPGTGDESGDSTPEGEDIPPLPKPNPNPKPHKHRRAAERRNSGDNPGTPKLKIVTPQVEFVEPDNFDYENHSFGIVWYTTSNKVVISTTFAPYMREVGRWCEKVSFSKAIVEAAVRNAYQVEYAATIVDANAQAKHRLDADQIERLKSDAALYAKALGMQALTERIQRYIKETTKNA